MYFLKTRTLSYITTVQTRNQAIIQCCHAVHSNSANSPYNVLPKVYNPIKDGALYLLPYFFSLLTWIGSSDFLFHELDSLRCPNKWLWRISFLLGSSPVFSWLDSDFASLARASQKWRWLISMHHFRWHVMPGDINFTTWLTLCLPGFSIVKLTNMF